MENLLTLANYNIAAQIPMDGYLGSGSAKQSNYEASFPNPSIAGVGAYHITNINPMNITKTGQTNLAGAIEFPNDEISKTSIQPSGDITSPQFYEY